MVFMTNWEVKLKGDNSFLMELAKEYNGPGLSITSHDEGWFLKSKDFNQLVDRADLFEKAGNIIEFINASARIFSNKMEPVESDGFWIIEESGQRKEEFFAVGKASFQIMNVLFSSGVAPKEWYQLWESNPEIKYIFRFFQGNSLLDWFSLFKIYETIRDDEQLSEKSDEGIKKIRSWTSFEENQIFFKTANWYRHTFFGKSKEKPNKKPLNEMSLADGNNYMRKLTIEWISWKVEDNKASSEGS